MALIFSSYEANEHASQRGPKSVWRWPLTPVWRTQAGPQRHGKCGPYPTASAFAQRLLGNITERLWNELTESARDGGSGSLPPINIHSQKNRDGGGQRQHQPPGGADRSWTHLSTGTHRPAGITGTREEHPCLLLTARRLGGSGVVPRHRTRPPAQQAYSEDLPNIPCTL